MPILEPVSREVFSIVQMKDEQPSDIQLFKRVDGRATRVEMERIDYQPHVLPVGDFHDFGRVRKSLNAAVRLSEEFERQRNPVMTGDVCELSQHIRRLTNDFSSFRVRWQRRWHDYDIRTADLRGDAA